MIILDDKIVGIWYTMLTDTQDWLLSIREIEPDAWYEITYRFRYYKDDKIFDTKDTKNWYQGIVKGTRSHTVDVIGKLAHIIHATAKIETPMYELINNNDFEDFQRKFEDAPFVHMRMTGPGDTTEIEEELSRITAQELGKVVGTKGHD